MARTTAEDLLDQIARIRRFSRNGFVAPNKPVTLLWALGRLEEGKSRLAPFAEAEEELQELLDGYGTPGTSPVHAFWRLQNDGLWEVAASGDLKPSSPNKEPPLAQMRAHASGGFIESVHVALAADANLRLAVEALLLGQLRAGAPGMYVPYPEGARETTSRLKRHAAFKRGVMTNFGSRCAVCGWAVRKGGNPVGLVAAHVHPLEHGGPDEAGNGFVLCWLHHAVFDAGLFSYDDERRLVVSSAWQEEGRGDMPSLLDFAGITVPEPADLAWRVRDEHLEWHRRNVFAGGQAEVPSTIAQ
jgi:putative restriction endonuclease